MKWRKSSYSGQGGGNCVEVGEARHGVLVRDTKRNEGNPVLRFTPEVWRRFAEQAKRSLAPEPYRGSRNVLEGHSRCLRVPLSVCQLAQWSPRTLPRPARDRGVHRRQQGRRPSETRANPPSRPATRQSPLPSYAPARRKAAPCLAGSAA